MPKSVDASPELDVDVMPCHDNAAAVDPTHLPVPEARLRSVLVDRGNERYRWRVLICRLFARGYRPDADRVRSASDFAYNNRKLINAAFDAGRLKADVLTDLAARFEASLAEGREHHGVGVFSKSEENAAELFGS